MARTQSKILTAVEQKAADTVATIKAQLKIDLAALKVLKKATDVATKAESKAEANINKLQTKLDKLQPPVAAAVQQPVTFAKAA